MLSVNDVVATPENSPVAVTKYSRDVPLGDVEAVDDVAVLVRRDNGVVLEPLLRDAVVDDEIATFSPAAIRCPSP